MWRTALGVVLLMILHNSAGAEEKIVVNLHWITDTQGCKVWDSLPTGGEAVNWSGPCVDGYADGKGKLTWYFGGSVHSTYEGEMQGGHYAGHGVQVWPTGARYDGGWKDDRADGKGTYRSATGEVCSGVWVNGCFQGGRCAHGVGASQCPPR